GLLQLRRRVRPGHGSGKDYGKRHDPSGGRESVRNSGWAARGHRLGRSDLVLRFAGQFFPCADWRLRGSSHRQGGWSVILPSGWTKTLVFIFLSPGIGLVLGAILMTSAYWLFRRWPPQRVDRYFRKLQLLSAAAYSLAHGSNDAQKTMSIIAGTLFTAGILKQFYIPFWVILMAHAAIGLGTLAGGWRIVKTM